MIGRIRVLNALGCRLRQFGGFYCPYSLAAQESTLNEYKNEHNDRSKNDKTYIPDEELRKFVPYVGKNSRFSRRVVSYYLTKIEGDKLKRKDIAYTNEMTEEKLKNQQLAKKIYQENLFDLHATTTFKILSLLKEITSSDDLLLDGKKVRTSKKRKFQQELPRQYYSEVPPLPEKLTPESFERYIHDLTHSNFYYRQASKNDGLVSNIITELLRYDNEKTFMLKQNINVFNDAIYFYARKFDLATMRELYHQLFKLKLIPNTKTLNLFLLVLDRLSQNPHGTPIIELMYDILQLFKHFGLRPDSVTYSLVYLALPEMTSKILLLEFMKKNEIPVKSGIMGSIVFDMLNFMSPEKVVELFESGSEEYHISDLDTICLNRIVDKALGKGKYEFAWDFVVKYKDLHPPNLKTMNTFLKHFSNLERADLCFGTLNTMSKHFSIKPDIVSYNHLIKCAVKVGFHPNWRSIIRILYHEKNKMTGTFLAEISSYWLTRAKARALADKVDKSKLLLRSPLSEAEINLSKFIKETLVWDDLKIIVRPWTHDNEQYKSAWSLVQYIKQRDHSQKPQSKSLRKHYKDFVKHKAMMNTYRLRAQTIIHNPQNALYKRLEQRGIIKDSKDFENPARK